ncbi:mediator of RNA polymerase II transcription subunit 25-like [Artemia franciscana]|uniref:mediator of RNA polymerase II transcription subunit 25-like n=1 Tax=Artemia franciscana TaxID=6661 RepID=UPI0032DB337E
MSVRSMMNNQVILDGCATNASLNDVVLVVEKTPALGAYLAELKSSYLIPSLEFFNGGSYDEKDYGSLSSSSTYSLVTYSAADQIQKLLYECHGPFTSPFKLMAALDKLQ